MSDITTTPFIQDTYGILKTSHFLGLTEFQDVSMFPANFQVLYLKLLPSSFQCKSAALKSLI